MTTQYGKVYLVGAGPGDPGLITVRGRECIARADVIIYDALANAQLLEDARPDAERIFVGKERDRHTLIQEEINRLLVEWAGKASHVVRLKGGDPFVFGRGGEEALLLAEHKIPFEVVPGVTAGIAVPAYAGIPVTHRGMATSVTLITGHNRENEPGKRLALDNIALTGTLVFYMGVKNLPTVVTSSAAWAVRPPPPPPSLNGAPTAASVPSWPRSTRSLRAVPKPAYSLPLLSWSERSPGFMKPFRGSSGGPCSASASR